MAGGENLDPFEPYVSRILKTKSTRRYSDTQYTVIHGLKRMMSCCPSSSFRWQDESDIPQNSMVYYLLFLSECTEYQYRMGNGMIIKYQANPPLISPILHLLCLRLSLHNVRSVTVRSRVISEGTFRLMN